jgi:hypothetical protein
VPPRRSFNSMQWIPVSHPRDGLPRWAHSGCQAFNSMQWILFHNGCSCLGSLGSSFQLHAMDSILITVEPDGNATFNSMQWIRSRTRSNVLSARCGTFNSMQWIRRKEGVFAKGLKLLSTPCNGFRTMGALVMVY